MAKKLLTAYTFTPGAANVGTIVVSGTYALEQFLLITNVTTGATIYQFNKSIKGGAISTGGGNTTLTLEADTSAMSAGDRLQVFVDDGQNAQVTLTNASVEISNDVGNPVPVSGTVTATGPLTDTQLRATAVPVSATALPLPSGAATSSNQSTANASLASLDSKAPALVTGRVPVDGSGVTQPVAPNITRGSGVTDANTQRVTLASDGPAVTALTSIDGKTPALVSGRQPVDGSGVTQPISASSLPLPTGAATAAKQPALGTAGIPSTDVLTVQGAASGTALPVAAASLPLPTGAATSALQTTGNTSLSSIDSKFPAQVSGSLPVLVQNGQLEVTNDTGNPLPVGPAATFALSGSASALNADLFSVDCSAYRSINFQITGTWVGTISFQVSNDNTNWNAFSVFSIAAGSGLLSSVTTNGAWFAALAGFNFVRIRFTTYTSGTASVAGFLLREPVSGATNATGAQITIATVSTASSSTLPYTVNSAATTNAASIKASGANLYGMSIMNASAATKYVRFFNKASAPTMGTDVPIMVVAVPATSSKEIEYVPAMRFGTGLAVAITGGAAATDSTAVAAGDVQLMVSYA